MEYRSVPLEVLRDYVTQWIYGCNYDANGLTDGRREVDLYIDSHFSADSQPVELKSQGYQIMANIDGYGVHVWQSPHINYRVGEHLVYDEVKYLITEVNHIIDKKEYVMVIQCTEEAKRYARGL